GTMIEKAIISDGCIIHAEEIRNAVIGVRSRIGIGSKIKSCYIMGNDYYETLEELAYNKGRETPMMGIGNNCELENVIVDKNCRIGDNVIIKCGKHIPDGDHSLFSIKDGIVVIKKGVTIQDNFVLE